MRKVLYLTGTRADFGLMESTLHEIALHPQLDVALYVTGTHFSTKYAESIEIVRSSGLPIAGELPVYATGESGEEMARVISVQLKEFSHFLKRYAPDILLLLGDRGEMLAAALSAVHLNIPIAHIHGGERSGTVDESIRHAISKLAHYHFTATPVARDRLIHMGEVEEHIFVTGAPGLNGLNAVKLIDKVELFAMWNIDQSREVCLFIFHPVVQEQSVLIKEVKTVIEALLEMDMHILWFTPNSDAGGQEIEEMMAQYQDNESITTIINMPRHVYLSWLKAARWMVGNSSSGIIEAASFGLNVLNIGSRQNLREAGDNVSNVPVVDDQFPKMLESFCAMPPYIGENIYYREDCAAHICRLLSSLPINQNLLSKVNAY
jgi:GDP/UDP-N,N'-diacetylbacillosamine 2-epimerase (hydrolysing)